MMEAMEALKQGGKPERRRAIAKYGTNKTDAMDIYIIITKDTRSRFLNSVLCVDPWCKSQCANWCPSRTQDSYQSYRIMRAVVHHVFKLLSNWCILPISIKQMQCTHTSDWMATEWHHVSAAFDFLKGKQRMRSDHQLDAPTAADGCVGPEHQGLSRKAESWLLGKRVSFFRRFRSKSTLKILATSQTTRTTKGMTNIYYVKSVRVIWVIMILAQASSVAKCDHVWSQSVGKQLPGSLLTASSSVAHLPAGRWRCWPIHDCPKVDGGCMVSMLSMVAMCGLPTLQ